MGLFNFLKKKEDKKVSPKHSSEYAELMTGQLVALYKQTHDKVYMDEYTYRLQKIGFSSGEAMNMFMFESMIVKYNAVKMLVCDTYLKANYFDFKSVKFPESNDYYISHQMFTCSEIVKIWDEAEWHYHNSSDVKTTKDVCAEIVNISRYGGGKLFVGYLQMMAYKSNIDIKKIQKYANAEQGLLYKYKWYPNGTEPHPYY